MTLHQAFLEQARSCARLGSPFMERLLTLLAHHWPATTSLAQKCALWSGDLGPNGASLPLRIAGGLHALVLTGQDAALIATYPPNDVPDADLTAAVLGALERHSQFMTDWIDNAPQTNEVRRSAALIPAAHVLATRFDLPFMISELGASGGLNLMWDRFALETDQGRLGPADAALTLKPDWTGAMPAPANIRVENRAGVDLNPLDVHDPDQALRLFAYLWPDQPHRADLTRAAIAVQKAQVDRADAVDWLDQRLTDQPDGCVHLIYHTIAWQYFPPERQKRGHALIAAAGARASTDRPLAWLGLEADDTPHGAALTLRLWPGGQTIPLGRADFHGRWVEWAESGLPPR
ncbi:DUF2332 domain-containing protein [Arenibacterium sp. CAU 1754]